jgi:hypothetical protein
MKAKTEYYLKNKMYIDSINVREYWRDSSFEEFSRGPGEPRRVCESLMDPIAYAIDVLFWYFHFLVYIQHSWGPKSSLVPPCKISLGGPAHSTVSLNWTLQTYYLYKGHDLDLCWVLQGGRMKDEQCMLWWLFQWWLTCVLFLYFFYNNHISFFYVKMSYKLNSFH